MQNFIEIGQNMAELWPKSIPHMGIIPLFGHNTGKFKII